MKNLKRSRFLKATIICFTVLMPGGLVFSLYVKESSIAQMDNMSVLSEVDVKKKVSGDELVYSKPTILSDQLAVSRKGTSSLVIP